MGAMVLRGGGGGGGGVQVAVVPYVFLPGSVMG